MLLLCAFCFGQKLDVYDPSKAGYGGNLFNDGVSNAINANGDATGIFRGTCNQVPCDVAFVWEAGKDPVAAAGNLFTQCSRPQAIDDKPYIYCENLRVGFYDQGARSLTVTQCTASETFENINSRAVAIDNGKLTIETQGTITRSIDQKVFFYEHPVQLKMTVSGSTCTMKTEGHFSNGDGDVTSAWLAGTTGGRGVGWSLDMPRDYNTQGADESNFPGLATVWTDPKTPLLLPPMATARGPRTLSPRAINSSMVVGWTMAWPNWWSIAASQAFVAGDKGANPELLPPVDANDEGYGAVGLNDKGIIIGSFHGGSRAGYWKKDHGQWVVKYLDDEVPAGEKTGKCQGSKVLMLTGAYAINQKNEITGRAMCVDPLGRLRADVLVFRLRL
jgi:hypothetical protein